MKFATDNETGVHYRFSDSIEDKALMASGFSEADPPHDGALVLPAWSHKRHASRPRENDLQQYAWWNDHRGSFSN